MGKGRKDVPINAFVMGTLRFAHPTQNWYVIFSQVPYFIYYTIDPLPPLSDDERKWIDVLLRAN